MPDDLEAQLRASLPGHETAMQDFARADRARAALGDPTGIIQQLRAHRAEIAVAINKQAPIHDRLAQALLLLAQVHADLERVHVPRLMLACDPAGKR